MVVLMIARVRRMKTEEDSESEERWIDGGGGLVAAVH